MSVNPASALFIRCWHVEDALVKPKGITLIQSDLSVWRMLSSPHIYILLFNFHLSIAQGKIHCGKVSGASEGIEGGINSWEWISIVVCKRVQLTIVSAEMP